MKVFTLAAEPREPAGTATARRERRGGRLPVVVYGEGRPPRHVSLATHDFVVALDHGARVLDLEMGDIGRSRVLLREVQYDALGRKVVHADFVRLNPKKQLTLAVPLEFSGSPAGQAEGGILTVLQDNVSVSCLPTNIPEGLEIDVAPLELGQTLYARDVALPENVELADNPDVVIVTVSIPRGVASEDEEAEAEGEGEVTGEAATAEGGADSAAESSE